MPDHTFVAAAPPFVAQVEEAVAPWNDPQNAWLAYNAALAAMFEIPYDLIADLGDASQTLIATLQTPLSTSSPISSLDVQSVGAPLATGTMITLATATISQTFEVSSPASVNDGAISVELTTPNYPYPIGSPVQLAYFPGWSVLLDPNNCPDQFLPFLAQFNGTDVSNDTDPVSIRAKILGESGRDRGTLSSVTSAVTRNLTGTQSIIVQERLSPLGSSDGYWFIVIVRPEEVVSVQAIIDAVNLTKPGGVQWTLIQTDGWTISQMEASQATITALEANFATLHGLEQDRPGT